jgi:hypothetical protein
MPIVSDQAMTVLVELVDETRHIGLDLDLGF